MSKHPEQTPAQLLHSELPNVPPVELNHIQLQKHLLSEKNSVRHFCIRETRYKGEKN